MVNENLVERFSQVVHAEIIAILLVNRMLGEEFLFFLESVHDGQLVVDLLLRTAFDAKIAQLETIDIALQ